MATVVGERALPPHDDDVGIEAEATTHGSRGHLPPPYGPAAEPDRSPSMARQKSCPSRGTNPALPTGGPAAIQPLPDPVTP